MDPQGDSWNAKASIAEELQQVSLEFSKVLVRVLYGQLCMCLFVYIFVIEFR